jgi:hypothetical protein
VPVNAALSVTADSDWRALTSEASERINAVNDITADLDQIDEETLTYEVTDEALEIAAGTATGTEAGSSLWSSFTPAGCTCVTDTD